MNEVECLKAYACFGGTQAFYRHGSRVVGSPMRFGVFTPPKAEDGPVPILFFLAGLTCNEETFAMKSGAQRAAAEHGVMLVMPDTSPRETGIPGADADWDFGVGASFYIDATREPWSPTWRMETYITEELVDSVADRFFGNREKVGIFGHSMGGHGAITLALKHPDIFRSVSAFAPVCHPSVTPWGIKAFTGYLGRDRNGWKKHDATELIAAGARAPCILVDQGLNDQFLDTELGLKAFVAACEKGKQPLRLRGHHEHDHSYYFISTFVEDHIRHHIGQLT
jgi:S-formylglutathione hydrolase